MRKRAPILPILIAVLVALPLGFLTAKFLPSEMDKYRMIIFFLVFVIVGGILIFLIGRLGDRRR